MLGIQWVFILVLSAGITFLMTPLFRFFAWKLQILDVPNERKGHNGPTPLLGGLSIYFGFIVSLGFYAVFSRTLLALVIAGTVILGIGLLDDYKGTSAMLRLILQIAAVVIVILNGIHFVFLPGGLWGILIEWLLTFLWILGITNALNFLDGLDGLAAGSSIIIAFYLGTVALRSSEPFLGWALAGIAGSCLGFLPYNLRVHDAIIFLGDAGSTFLGFMLASMAVMCKWGPNNNIIKTFTPPLLIFGLLIFDLIHISLDRIMNHKVNTFKEWIDFVGKDHLHHRLEALGMTKKEVVMFIFLFEICLGAGAVLIRQIHSMHAVLLLIQGIGMIALFTILEHLGNNELKDKYKTQDSDCLY
jgi:UDP-GlcNAc:undecaprenyl-phosphate GlcNAc-1-phosphate transferase